SGPESFPLLEQTTMGELVTQTPRLLIVKEGAPLRINCTYEYGGYPNLFWYTQHLDGGSLQFLLREEPQENIQKRKDGFFAAHLKEEKSFHLQKESSDLSDSADYFCSFSAQW
uniref:Ig-like domain-containing protein n=1 Tax=Varanus komodoensis TaxID=61221 RepID=A0A8D2L962_VARKO